MPFNPDIQNQFNALRPWVSKIVIDGHEYGGDLIETNLAPMQARQRFKGARTVLELGPLNGAQTIELARIFDSVVTVEARPDNCRRVELVCGLLGRKNVRVVQGDLETLDLQTLGNFDLVFASGILYHMRKPWDLLRRISQVSRRLFLWSLFHNTAGLTLEADGYPGNWHAENGLGDPLSGMSEHSFWPTLGGIFKMLKDHRWGDIEVLGCGTENPWGLSVSLTAQKVA